MEDTFDNKMCVAYILTLQTQHQASKQSIIKQNKTKHKTTWIVMSLKKTLISQLNNIQWSSESVRFMENYLNIQIIASK